MICLAFGHAAFDKLLNWTEDLSKLTAINRQIFVVHTVFVATGILMLGLVCLFFSGALVAKSLLGLVANASFAMCWLSRLVCQFFVFKAPYCSNKRLEILLRVSSTLLWIFYTALFAAVFLYQLGAIGN